MMRPGVLPVAMISGASRGIGAAVARELAAQGWRLSLGLRNPAAAPVSGPHVLAHAFDATDPASEAAWTEATLARFGRIDGLVLNAGILIRKTVLEATEADFDEIMAVNVKSPMRLAQRAWPALEAVQGRIVLMSSLSGKRIKSAPSGLYGLSKFALTGLAAALRQCGKESGVRATAICPSYVASDMSAGALDAGTMTRAEDIARIIRMVLELPPTASLPEIAVHYTVEDCY